MSYIDGLELANTNLIQSLVDEQVNSDPILLVALDLAVVNNIHLSNSVITLAGTNATDQETLDLIDKSMRLVVVASEGRDLSSGESSSSTISSEVLALIESKSPRNSTYDKDEVDQIVSEVPLSYKHSQGTDSVSWVINHNLGRSVVVALYTVGGAEMLASVTNINLNQSVASFDVAISGYAITT